jgi:SpoIID/LytB domain protein
VLSAALIFSPLATAFTSYSVHAEEIKVFSQPIEVKLVNYLGNKSSIPISFKGSYRINGSDISLTEGISYSLKNESGTLVLYANTTKLQTFTSQVSFYPLDYNANNLITINGIDYIGDFTFKTEGSYVRPYNTLELEDYLKGVVPYEMSNSWNIEALKAQAVAARTYALGKGSMTVDDTTNNQVYKGYSALNTNSNLAVDETKGEALMYGGKYIGAYYSSTNGGKELSVTNSWGSSLASYPYLTKKDDPYSIRAGQYLNWNFALNNMQIDISNLDLTNPDSWWGNVSEKDTSIINSMKAKITPSGSQYKITSISDITFKSEPYSATDVLTGGFVVKYFEKNTNGYVMQNNKLLEQTKVISGVRNDTLRSYYGSSLKSPNVSSVTFDGTKYIITGSGYGHGIGMSQWGAYQMAKEGFNFHDILAFYYPGTDLVNVSPVQIGSVQAIVDSNNQVLVQYSLNKDSNVQISVDNTDIYTANLLSGSQSFVWDGKALSAGDHSFVITAIDRSGNTSSANGVFTLNNLNNPVISNFIITQSNDQLVINYETDQDSKVIASIDTYDKIYQTILNGEQIRGSHQIIWKHGNNPNSIYHVTIVATNKSGKSVTQKKTIVWNPVISTKEKLYTVIKGDTLSALSKKFSVTVDSVKKRNNLPSVNLYIGQKIVIPAVIKQPVASISYYTVVKGDTLYTVAKKNKISTTDLVKLNSLKSTVLRVGQKLIIKKIIVEQKTTVKTISTSYIVKRGDTLWSVSKKFEIPVDSLKKLNGLKTNSLHVGEKLITK